MVDIPEDFAATWEGLHRLEKLTNRKLTGEMSSNAVTSKKNVTSVEVTDNMGLHVGQNNLCIIQNWA